MEKTCANHPDTPSTAACKVCEKPLCASCATATGGKILCSPECVEVYKEVTHWIDRKASPEEWNPLASTPLGTGAAADEPTISGLPKDETVLEATRARPAPPPEEETLQSPPGPTDDPSITIRRRDEPAPDAPCAFHPEVPAVGLCSQCGKPFCGSCAIEMSWGKFCSIECSIVQPTAPRRKRLLLWVAATILAGVAVVLFWPDPNKPPPVAKATPMEAPKVEAPKAELPKPVPPPAEPPKVVAKPVDPKSEPPEPNLAPVEPTPKPPPPAEPPKPEPPKPAPVVVAPKPEPPVPPPVAEPPKPEPPKPVPVPPSVNVGQSLDEAAGLIRDVAPLFKEIADSLNENVSDLGALRSLLGKVERVRKNLREAQQIYLRVAPVAPDPTLIDGRIRRIDSLLETTAGCLEQIKSRL